MTFEADSRVFEVDSKLSETHLLMFHGDLCPFLVADSRNEANSWFFAGNSWVFHTDSRMLDSEWRTSVTGSRTFNANLWQVKKSLRQIQGCFRLSRMLRENPRLCYKDSRALSDIIVVLWDFRSVWGRFTVQGSFMNTEECLRDVC